jgi:hypothetical protein
MSHGCIMCHSLYVKANGEMPCWDDTGETLTLRVLDETALGENRESPIFHGAELHHIREAFLDGRVPHPGVCESCAVRGHGAAIDLSARPRVLEVLHLEASYSCAPYHMRAAFLEGLLRELREEGVEDVRFIHFEGRGDPLANSRLCELVELSKSYFPASIVGATTHGSYPYMPWIVDSKLDLLRVSIDGATPESYSKYRVGGDFDRVMTFLARLRDDRIRARSPLRVEWKYILFEWNDSNDEIERAARLAEDLQVHLTFVRTHTPGRSKRFQSDSELRENLLRLAPDSGIEPTFPLKSPQHSAGAVVAEHVTALLSLALQRLRLRDEQHAIHLLVEALKHDPGIAVLREATTVGGIIECNSGWILENARFPSTLTSLAALSREAGKPAAAEAFLLRYLELAPDAPDRQQILCDRFARAAVRYADRREFHHAHRALWLALRSAFGVDLPFGEVDNPTLLFMERLLRTECPPALVSAFAMVARSEAQFWTASTLFRRYLELSPEAWNRQTVEEILAGLDEQIRLRATPSTLIDRLLNRLRRSI